MAGMKFLNLKGWHPSNARNQKRLWIAEQKAKERQERELEAAAEVRKDADAQRFQALAAAKGDAESARKSEQMQVGFMYAPPPGLQKVDETAVQNMTEDDAVREFRRKMEKRTAATKGEDVQRPLERYVGRRPDEMLTIKEQVERFPFLKDAPVEGDYAANVKVNFKPMGRQVRNVKCMRCGEWGHASGDRECAMRDSNPHDAARQMMEDPMTQIAKLNAERKQQLVLKKSALPLEMQGASGGGAKPEFEILLSDDEEAGDAEKSFLASLSTKEKRKLLKKLRQQTKDERESQDSDSSSSSSSSSDDRRRRSKKRSKTTKHASSSKRKSTRDHNDRHSRDSRLAVHEEEERKSSRSLSPRHRSHKRRSDGEDSRYRSRERRTRSRSRSRDRRSRRGRSNERRH